MTSMLKLNSVSIHLIINLFKLYVCVRHDCSKHIEQCVKLPSVLHDITVLVQVVDTIAHTQVISVMSVYSEFYILKYFYVFC